MIRFAPLAIALVAGAFFLSTGLSALDKPGLHYDETAFVNAALGADHPDQHFVHARFHGVVTKIFPYIGALKSWIFAPVFSVFGVSPESMRAPAVLLGLLAVALAVLLAWRVLGPWPAALLAVVLGTDPTFVTMSKADWGPIVLSALLRVGALVAYFALLRTRHLRYAWLLAAALLIGLFNKVDFAWFMAALGAAALLIHGRELFALVRARPLAAALPVVAFLAVLGFLTVESVLPARELPLETTRDTLEERLEHRWDLYHGTYSGRSVYGFMTARELDPLIPAPAIYVGAALAGLIAFGGALLSRLPRDEGRLAGFLLVQLLVIGVFLVATRQVGGSHHLIQLWPLPQLLLVTVVAVALRLRPRALRAGVAGAALAVVLWMAAVQVVASREYVDALADGDSFGTVWTPEIYDVADRAGELAPTLDGVVAADWGIGPQVFALNGDAVRERFRDLPPDFADGAHGTEGQVAANHFDGRRVMVMFHQEETEVFKGSSLGVRKVIGALGPEARVREVYAGKVLRAYVVDDRPGP
ncbi:MAG: glycosyltransferase family 39 protein [Actinomycetota bacterium]|nr:glycosyltransferase family 39 protein [Actinomycetota bacterium]